MNSYNENLQVSVANSLSSQELELKTVASVRNASMFSLYYAQGARITSAEKLDAMSIQYEHQRALQQAAVNDNNVAINLMDASAQGKSGTAQSVTNVAVAAANVQVAANAILKLASNVGGIATIANAADFDTQIYALANDAERYIGNTAFEAEKASQYAMEASSLAAQVSISTVNDQAKAAGAGMQTLLNTLTAQFNSTADSMAAQNATFSTSSDAEKKAEGLLEDINVNYFATREAYALTNSELNLNVSVPSGSVKGNGGMMELGITNTYYTVVFNPLQSAFPQKKSPTPGYPVDDYYLFLVRYDQSAGFSLSMADSLIDDDKTGTFHKIDGTLPTGSKFFQEKIYVTELNDVNNNELDLGEMYTIFVYAKLTETYKKTLNNFNNYLSAPSPSFKVVNQIESPTPIEIIISPEPSGSKLIPHTPVEKTISVEFTVLQDKLFYEDVEYRLYLLPDQTSLVQGLLTASGLRSLEDEVKRLEEIADKYDPQIHELNEQINSLEASKASFDEQIEIANQQLVETNAKLANTNSEDKEAIAALNAEITALNLELTTFKSARKEGRHELKLAEHELKSLMKEKAVLESKIDPNAAQAPGFFFNTLLAEQVAAGSYTKFENVTSKVEPKTDYRKIKGKLKFEGDMTDNFGNPLVSGANYIAAILATVSLENSNPQQFSSSLSDFENTPSFIYQA